MAMGWRYNIPCECDYDSYEDFRDAMNAWEDALDNYCDRMQEDYMERR
jgi:hypothetical protein